MSLVRLLYDQIGTRFKEHPHRFFTEHDIHTELALLATEFLKDKGGVTAKTKDGFIVNRIYHEYPTPFRCRMKGFDFRLVTEEEFKEERRSNPNFRARRGYVDFVILNSAHVSSNKLSVISAKRYRDFRATLNERQHPALDVAIEVVFFPTFDEKVHEGIMNRRVESTIQDYQKLVALMKSVTPNNIPFCEEASMMFFSNTKYKEDLEAKFSSFSLNERVGFFRILSQ